MLRLIVLTVSVTATGLAQTGAPSTPASGGAAAGPATTGGFSGVVRASASSETKISALIFRTLPSDANPAGRQFRIPVNPDGTFATDEPLPATIDAIDDSRCADIASLDLRLPSGEVFALVADGAITAAGKEAVGVRALTAGPVAVVAPTFNASFTRPVGGGNLKLELGGINVGCAKPVRPR